MKSGLAAAMVAAAAFKRAGVGLRGKLVVGALVDEEDGMIGVRHLCETAVGRELDAAIICEPEENELCLEQRGVVWARFRVRGKMAHGAMPEAGINPDRVPRPAAGRAPPALERRLRKACEKSRYLRPPTVTPTIIQGPPPRVGVPQSNVIPAVAETTFDIRLTPGIGDDGIRAELEAICRDAAAAQPGIKVEWEPVNALPARHPGRSLRGRWCEAMVARREAGHAAGPRALRRGARLDRRHDPPDAARHPDRDLRAR